MHPHHELGGERAAPYYLGNLFGNPSETGLIAARLIFAGVFERFPKLRCGVIDSGAGWVLEFLRELDIGFKSEGILPLTDVQSSGETVKPGDKLPLKGVEAVVVSSNGEVLDKPVYAYSNFLHAIRSLPVRIAD